MMDRDCERWIAIADAGVLGDAVSAADREFERDHRAACPRCRGEASLWSSLRPSRLQAVPSTEDVDELVRLFAQQVPAEPAKLRSSKRSRRAVALGAGAALLAAAAVFAFWVEPRGPVAMSQLPASAAAPVTHALSTGRYTSDTCGEAGEAVTLCVFAGSEISTSEPSARGRVRLTRGAAVVALAPRATGASFSLVTERGEVSAVAAKFRVEIGPHGEAAVRVHQGNVHVRATGSTTATVLGEGQALRLGAKNVEPVPEAERERDLRLLSSANADAR